MHILSKSTYIKGEQCEKLLYLTKNRPFLRDKLSIEQRTKFQRGTDVGIIAQSLFPNGINMSPSRPNFLQQKAEETAKNIQNPDIKTMYEAVFIYEGTLIMVDIMTRDGDGWRIIEVKSSMSLSQTYLKDAALQYYVLKGCGIHISDMQLMYINKNYIRHGDINLSELFIAESVVDFASDYAKTIERNIDKFKKMLTQPHSPDIIPGEQCENPYKCDFYGFCHGLKKGKTLIKKNTQYSIDYKTFFSLFHIKNDTVFLNVITDKPAIPIVDGDHPYEEQIIGYSILTTDNQNITNNCFDDYSKRESLLESMTRDLKHFANILVFTPFELKEHLLKHEKPETKNVICRINNFREILIQSSFSHPLTEKELSLRTLSQVFFPEEECFEHARILMNAKSGNILNHELAISDMEIENVLLKKIVNCETLDL